MALNVNATLSVTSTQSGRAESGAERNATFSEVNFSIATANRQHGKVELFLRERGHIGRRHAISREELVEALGFDNVRSLRAAIARERKRGSLILSSTQAHGGYFLPSDGAEGQQEMKEFVESCHNRAVNIFDIAKPMRQALGIVDGQLTLTLDDERRDGGSD